MASDTAVQESGTLTLRERTVEGVERNEDGTFTRTGIAFWWPILRLSYYQLHAACGRLGMREIKTDEDLLRVIHYFQKRAVPFTVLQELYGPATPVRELAKDEVLP